MKLSDKVLNELWNKYFISRENAQTAFFAVLQELTDRIVRGDKLDKDVTQQQMEWVARALNVPATCVKDNGKDGYYIVYAGGASGVLDPMVYSSDAFYIQAKLRMSIKQWSEFDEDAGMEHFMEATVSAPGSLNKTTAQFSYIDGDDHETALRAVIVRCAAAYGKFLEERDATQTI